MPAPIFQGRHCCTGFYMVRDVNLTNDGSARSMTVLDINPLILSASVLIHSDDPVEIFQLF